MKLGWVIASALALAGGARAEVVASAPGGFRVRSIAEVLAPPDKVWAAVLSMPKWWNPAHTYSGDGDNLSFDAKAGGCFCERLKHGGGVLHATVVQVQPRNLLRLNGGLGPLQGEGVAGAWTIELKPSATGTTLTQTYTVGGYTPTGLSALAEPVDGVMAEQAGRLKRYAETGRP